jgi:hypothetical protein
LVLSKVDRKILVSFRLIEISDLAL